MITERDFLPLDQSGNMADAIVRPSVSYWKDVFRRIRGDRVAVASFCVILVITLFALFAPMFGR